MPENWNPGGQQLFGTYGPGMPKLDAAAMNLRLWAELVNGQWYPQPELQHHADFAEAISQIEGQTLYELHVQVLKGRGWSCSQPFGQAAEDTMCDPHPPQWKHLNALQQRFWCEIATEFIKLTGA